MKNTLPVSTSRLAGLLRLTGVSRPVAAILAVGIVGLATFFMNSEIPGMSQAAAASPKSATFTLTGKVVQVSDGDTINILIDRETHRIRLASIDAPETSHGSARPGQPFGEASRKNLAEYVAGKTLTLTCYEKDRYGRDVCDVPVGETTANRLQVEKGMAWANQQGGGKYLRDRSLIELEKQARAQKLGLWAEPNAVAPWVWRDVCWQKQKC